MCLNRLGAARNDNQPLLITMLCSCFKLKFLEAFYYGWWLPEIAWIINMYLVLRPGTRFKCVVRFGIKKIFFTEQNFCKTEQALRQDDLLAKY